jgi:hypothetical protein
LSKKLFNEKGGKKPSLFKFNEEKTNNFTFNQNLTSNSKEINIKDNILKTSTKNEPLISNDAYRELYKTFSLIIKPDQLDEIDKILHGERINEREYKYGLPAKNDVTYNELIPINKDEQIPNTPTENLYSLLDLNGESSYESLILKFKEEYNSGIYTFINNNILRTGYVWECIKSR